jgi:hypothetical protein
MTDRALPQTFFFRYRCPTRLAFGTWKGHQREKPEGGSFEYRGDSARVLAFDERLHTQPKTHYGLGFDIQITRSDIDRAQEAAAGIVLDLVGLLAFVESCAIGRPQFALRYSLPSHGTTLRDARAHVLDADYRPNEVRLRLIDRDRLATVFAAIHSVQDSGRREGIKHALHWMWKSFSDENLRDRFLHMWIGLEHLEPKLKRISLTLSVKRGSRREVASEGV